MDYSRVVLLFLAIAVAEGTIGKNWYDALKSTLNTKGNIQACLDSEFGKLERKLNLFSAENCKMYLITGYGKKSIKMTASSYYDSSCPPLRGILNTEESRHGTGSWCPRSNGQSEYLQVELPFISWITGLATQGRDSHTYNNQWVKSYRVLYSIDCKTWKTVGKGNGQVFTGNSNVQAIKTNMFSSAFRAKCIRVKPYAYHVHKSLRLDIIGCKF